MGIVMESELWVNQGHALSSGLVDRSILCVYHLVGIVFGIR